jgi:hypothetical protein
VSLRAIHDIFDITESVYQIGLAITKVRMIGSKKVPRVRIDIEECAFVDCATLRISVVDIKNYLSFLAAETNSSSAYLCLVSHRD